VLPAQHRLRHEKDIKTLFANGKSVFDPVCGMKYRRNSLPASRFAVVIGTKVSKSAVKRNAIRRKVREVVRGHLPKLAVGYDVLFLVRPEAAKKTQVEIESHVLQTLRRSPLWPRAVSSSS